MGAQSTVKDGVFRKTRVVGEQDIDQLGHVNNVAWVRFVVEMAEQHSEAVGFGFEGYKEAGGIWMVRRHEVDYHGAALPGETVVEETWVESFRGARSVRCTRFTKEDGTRLVSAKTHWAYLDAETLRPRRVDETVLAKFPVHAER